MDSPDLDGLNHCLRPRILFYGCIPMLASFCLLANKPQSTKQLSAGRTHHRNDLHGIMLELYRGLDFRHHAGIYCVVSQNAAEDKAPGRRYPELRRCVSSQLTDPTAGTSCSEVLTSSQR